SMNQLHLPILRKPRYGQMPVSLRFSNSAALLSLAHRTLSPFADNFAYPLHADFTESSPNRHLPEANDSYSRASGYSLIDCYVKPTLDSRFGCLASLSQRICTVSHH